MHIDHAPLSGERGSEIDKVSGEEDKGLDQLRKELDSPSSAPALRL